VTDPILAAIFGGLLVIALSLAWPALFTAIRLIRTERTFGKLFWHVLTAIDLGSRSGAA
jgi:hypothetical protein